MWSSWPCVSTIASMSSSRSEMYSKSGRIRSTPGWLSSGNSTPQSMTSSRPAYSRTAMLRPISPSPPSATMRSAPSARTGGRVSSGWGWLMNSPGLARDDVQQTGSAQTGAQRDHVVVRRGHVGQPHVSVGDEAKCLDGRLGEDRLKTCAVERVDRGDDREEDLERKRVVAGVERRRELGEPAPGDVPDDAHDTRGTVGEQRQVRRVVAAVPGETGPGDR